MTLNVSTVGDNAQTPGISSNTFIPDQLIASAKNLVSDLATISGSAVLKRGSVMGRSLYGALAATAGIVFASGTILLAALPVDGDTLTIQGTVITFKNNVPNVAPPANTVYIGTTTALTAQALLAMLDNSLDANLIKMTYTLAGSTITATAAVPGTGGNAYTLATSDATNITLSGANLTGGTANTGNATVSGLTGGQSLIAGQYKAVCLTATTAQVYNPRGEELGVATFGTAFKNAEINLTITAGGTPCVAGDTFVFVAAPTAAGVYSLCTAGATDGTEFPAAILVDDTDPTAGNVLGGVYLMGEFNAGAVVIDPSLSLAAVKAAFLNKGSIFLKGAVPADDPS